MARYVVARADALSEGEHIVVDVDGRSIGVFLLDGGYYGLLNRCPHRGGPMCRGSMVGALESDGPGDYRLDMGRRLLECPWHGWEFDIKTGQSWCHPESVKARTYQVAVVAGETLAKGPFVAETVPVSVEQNYVVGEL